MQYLILHKVSGSPAFDVAEKIQIGDEEGWIIPTSGHRAYPYWHVRLDNQCGHITSNMPPMPDDWPDHYQITDVPAKKGGLDIDIGTILSGLMPTGKFPRRA